MIPARPGTTADLANDLVPVEAWDDEGRALVIDEASGRLVPAAEQPGFRKVYRSDVLAIIPGGGWLADYRTKPLPGRLGTTPVVAWGLKASGFVEPYIWRGEDRVVEVLPEDDYITLRHPDESPTE